MEKYRAEIDEIDDNIVALFKRRMAIALEIGKYKRENGLPILNREREREVYYRVAERAGEDMERYAKALYATLLEVSRSYQRTLTPSGSALRDLIESAPRPAAFPKKAVVACQGVEGAYSQQACDRMFEFPRILYFENFESVFQAVEKGMCAYGVLPIENSYAGSVAEVYKLMERHKFHIVRGMRLKIDHALLANGASLSTIREVYSHPQALAQCAGFFAAHPHIRAVPEANTAAAAKRVRESGREDVAAIASRSCKEIYGLNVLADDISDVSNNYTRFIVIGKALEVFPGANKVSMTLSISHEPGALSSMIARIAALGLNLTKLESRPIPEREFEFRFHFDIEASLSSPEVVDLLVELEKSCADFALLGNYPEGY